VPRKKNHMEFRKSAGKENTGEKVVKEMKQAESGSLLTPSGIVCEFCEVDQARRENEAMTPESESGNDCECSLAYC
jgi:hypothetical protein